MNPAISDFEPLDAPAAGEFEPLAAANDGDFESLADEQAYSPLTDAKLTVTEGGKELGHAVVETPQDMAGGLLNMAGDLVEQSDPVHRIRKLPPNHPTRMRYEASVHGIEQWQGAGQGAVPASVFNPLGGGGNRMSEEMVPATEGEVLGRELQAKGQALNEKVGGKRAERAQERAIENPRYFAGRFGDNPSLARAATGAAPSVPGMLLATVNPLAGAALMSAQETLPGYVEMRRNGFDPDEAFGRSAISAVGTLALEKLPFDMTAAVKGSKLAGKLGPAMTAGLVVLLGAASEAGTEVPQEFLQWAVQQADGDISLEDFNNEVDVLSVLASSGLMGGGIHGGQQVFQGIINQASNRAAAESERVAAPFVARDNEISRLIDGEPAGGDADFEPLDETAQEQNDEQAVLQQDGQTDVPETEQPLSEESETARVEGQAEVGPEVGRWRDEGLRALLDDPNAADLMDDLGPEFKERLVRIESAVNDTLDMFPDQRPVSLVGENTSGKPMGYLITKSTKQPGRWQVSVYDENGFIGDQTYATKEEAIVKTVKENSGNVKPTLTPPIDQWQFTEKFHQGYGMFGTKPNIDKGVDVLPDGSATIAVNDFNTTMQLSKIPVKDLQLSADVPNFKADADPRTGVVDGQRLGTFRPGVAGPIYVWRRMDGRMEVISGRHRFDSAKRSGEREMLAYVLDEAAGFSRADALTLDSELNILDGQGKVKDYANYFRNTEIDGQEASQRGLLARDKGRAGWALGRLSGDSLYTSYRNGQIAETKAVAIAEAAPGNDDLQRVGLDYALQNKQAGAEEIRQYLNAVQSMTGRAPSGEQMDMFGSNDAALNQAREMAKIALKIQRGLIQQRQVLKSARSVSKLSGDKAAILDEFGVKAGDVDAINAKLDELEAEINGWNAWATDPERVARVRRELEGGPAAADSDFELIPQSEADIEAERQEQARLEAQRKMQEEMDAPLTGDTGDLGQSSLFEEIEPELFSGPSAEGQGVQSNKSLEEFLNTLPETEVAEANRVLSISFNSDEGFIPSVAVQIERKLEDGFIAGEYEHKYINVDKPVKIKAIHKLLNDGKTAIHPALPAEVQNNQYVLRYAEFLQSRSSETEEPAEARGQGSEVGGQESDSTVLTLEKVDEVTKYLIEGGIRSRGILDSAAEYFGMRKELVAKIRKYLLKRGDQYMETQAEVLSKGWDGEEVGIGEPLKKGSETYTNQRALDQGNDPTKVHLKDVPKSIRPAYKEIRELVSKQKLTVEQSQRLRALRWYVHAESVLREIGIDLEELSLAYQESQDYSKDQDPDLVRKWIELTKKLRRDLPQDEIKRLFNAAGRNRVDLEQVYGVPANTQSFYQAGFMSDEDFNEHMDSFMPDPEPVRSSEAEGVAGSEGGNESWFNKKSFQWKPVLKDGGPKFITRKTESAAKQAATKLQNANGGKYRAVLGAGNMWIVEQEVNDFPETFVHNSTLYYTLDGNTVQSLSGPVKYAKDGEYVRYDVSELEGKRFKALHSFAGSLNYEPDVFGYDQEAEANLKSLFESFKQDQAAGYSKRMSGANALQASLDGVTGVPQEGVDLMGVQVSEGGNGVDTTEADKFVIRRKPFGSAGEFDSQYLSKDGFTIIRENSYSPANVDKANDLKTFKTRKAAELFIEKNKNQTWFGNSGHEIVTKRQASEEYKSAISNESGTNSGSNMPGMPVDPGAARVKGRGRDMPVQPETPVGLDQKLPASKAAARIVKYIEDAFNVKVRGKMTYPRTTSLGHYELTRGLIRLNDIRDIDTAIHELGHRLDRMMATPTRKNGVGLPPAVSAELEQMGKNLYGNRKPAISYQSEGLAEYLAFRIMGADPAGRAPATHKWFNEWLIANPAQARAMNRLERKVNDYRVQGAAGRVRGFREDVESRNPFSWDWSPESTRARMAAWKGSIYDKVVDVNDGIRRRIEEAGINRAELNADEDPFELATAFAMGAPGKAREAVFNQVVDVYGRRQAESLLDALSPIGKDAPKERQAKFWDYMVALRALNINRSGRESGVSNADAAWIAKEYDSAEFREAAQRVTDWAFNLMQLRVDSGMMSQVDMDKIRADNPVYVPFRRQFAKGELRVNRSGVAQGRSLFRLKGSGREIEPPLESLISLASNTYAAAQKETILNAAIALHNKALKRDGMDEDTGNVGFLLSRIPPPKVAEILSLNKTLDAHIRQALAQGNLDAVNLMEMFQTELGDLDTQIDDEAMLFKAAREWLGKENVVVKRTDSGSIAFYEVSPELYSVLHGKDRLPNWLTTGSKALVDVVRLGATGINPSFAIRNLMRDVWTTSITSDYGTNPLKALQGIRNEMRKTEMSDLYNGSAVALSGWFGQDKANLKGVANKVTLYRAGKEVQYEAGHPIDLMRNVIGFSEAGPRFAEFEAAYNQELERTGSESAALVKATVAAKDVSVNFSRAGEWVREANSMWLFLNAGVQSLDKAGRTFRDHPVRTLQRGGMYITFAAVASYLSNREKEWWRKLPPHEKFGKVWFDFGEGTRVGIPLPFEFGHLFGGLPVAMLESERDPNAMMKWRNHVMNTQLPDLAPTALKPIFESVANEDWRGREIVPHYLMQNREKQDWYNDQTSELAKAAGRMFGVSPAHAEHLVNAYTGGIYKRMFRVVDRWERGEFLPETKSDLPILGTLFLREGYTGTYEDFKAEMDRQTRKRGSGKSTLEDIGRYRLMAKAEDLAGDNFSLLRDLEKKQDMDKGEKKQIEKQIRKEIDDMMLRSMNQDKSYYEQIGAEYLIQRARSNNMGKADKRNLERILQERGL